MKPIRIFCALLFLAAGTNLNAQILGSTVAYWDFANGIPEGFDNGSSSGISHWEYRGPNTNPDINVASRGSCGTGSVPITSQSWANGFVIFDSNYWDDDDNVCGGLGTGQDPAPHTSWLITTPIDLSTSTTAVFTFQQSFKDYQATLRVQISINGGTDWTDILLNTGSFTPSSEWKTVNVTSIAAGQSDVRFRFLWEGTYYWWQLDDIAVYSPNPNDLRVLFPKYTLYNPSDTILFNDMEYDAYPSVMIPSFKFSATGQNIGGNTQTQVKLLVRVKRLPELTQVFGVQSPTNTLTAGQSSVYSISTPYTAPTTTNEYIITYNVDQAETDFNVNDNLDTLDFRITPFTYARDEGTLTDVFTPAAIYQDEVQEVGNIFQARANNLKCTSIGVVLGEGTEPGTPIYGIIYNLDRTVIYGVTDTYIVNAADINSSGGSNVTCLQLQTPVTLVNQQHYLVMVGHDVANGGTMRIGRDGVPPDYASLVSYPQSNALYYMLKTPMVRMHIFPSAATPGCLDPLADNYDPAATVSDECCIYSGCIDPTACNYDPSSNFDDGNCCYNNCVELVVTSGSADAEISWTLTDALGGFIESGGGNSSTTLCLEPGCYLFNMNDAGGNGWNGANYSFVGPAGIVYSSGTLESGAGAVVNVAIGVNAGCTDPAACNFLPSASCDDGSCSYPGCIDVSACNYDPTKGCDDGSCSYPGCTDIAACNYNVEAGCEDGSCTYPGCIDPTACNFVSIAGCDDGSCTYPGCTDINACNFNVAAGCDDGSCTYPGCTDATACNFVSTAGCDDGSCTYPGCTDAAACNYNAAAGCENGSCTYPGCVDPAACNFDSIAGCDDGSCTYPGCIDPAACNFDSTAGCDDGSCNYPGCTDPTACNFDSSAQCADGSCIYPGCINASACNYNSQAGCDDGSCVLPGCIDPLACNYDVTKGCDDGSCTYPGCNDVNACNYNPAAGCADGSCTYPGCTSSQAPNYNPAAGCDDGSCISCNADLNNDGTVNITDVLIFTSKFGCTFDCGPSDINDDGAVNITDLLLLLTDYGDVCF